MKKFLIGLLSFLSISLLLFFGCYSSRFDNNLKQDIDELQKQVFELHQDQAYINTKIEQVLSELSPLYERIEMQEKKIREISMEKTEKTKVDVTSVNKADRNKDGEGKAETLQEDKESDEMYPGPKKLYDQALSFLNKDIIEPAISLLNKYLELYPRTDLADNARYWLGECYYKKGEYTRALDEFQRILTDYPKGNKIPAALLKMGYAYYELEQTSEALGVLERIIKFYPNDTTYLLAKKKIESILSERGLHE